MHFERALQRKENVGEAAQWMHSEVEGFDWRVEENESVSFPHLNESFVRVLYPSQSIFRVKLLAGQCGKVTDLHNWRVMKPLSQRSL